MTTKELADYIKLNEKTVLKMAQKGNIPGIKIGNQWRFHIEAVDQYIQKGIVERTPDKELDQIISTTEHIIPFSRLIKPELIELDLKAGTIGTVLENLAGIAERSGILGDRQKLLTELKAREKMLSTAVGQGVAVPHPRHPHPGLFRYPNIVLLRTAKGMDMKAPDKKKVRLFFMTCAPNVFVHLRLLAKIAKVIQRKGVIESFMEAGNREDVIRLLLELEREKILPLS
jgi:PTS system nitrogen regulatory IIA component